MRTQFELTDPANVPVLQQNEVHVWLADIRQNSVVLDYYKKQLSAEEIEQSEKFYFEKDKIRHVIVHGILRLLIYKYTDIPASLQTFSYNKFKKPELSNPGQNLKYNLSHSGNFAIFAFSLKSKLGIDIEQIRQMNDADSIIERFCSEYERKEYFSIPAGSRNRPFFNCWSRKEAYIKARGEGLYFPLDKFSIPVKPDEQLRIIEIQNEPSEAEKWKLHNISFDENYSGALVCESSIKYLRFYRWAK